MDPNPHGSLVTWIRIRIHIRIKKKSGAALNKNLFADDKPICIEYEPILAIFQGFEPLFDRKDLDQDPDPHQGGKVGSGSASNKSEPGSALG